ncbi:MAG: N-formylglutamate amidohydrolase [Caulobacteraceae bacterium]
MDAGDIPVLAVQAALEPPFEVRRPPGSGARPATPLVFASPHSGRLYPADMRASPRLDAGALRSSEDALVDLLLEAAPRYGGAVLLARYARAYVDVNREPWELDQAMFDEDLPEFARARTARVAAGLGSIARLVAEGREIYDRKLTFAEAAGRIEAVHRPYHRALTGLVEAARAAFGVCVLVDWHSMPGAAAGQSAQARRPVDMVLGDRFGSTCAGTLTERVERQLTRLGYIVARNAPYAGGYTTEAYGRPLEGVHALQIEISRALYLDEATLAPKPDSGGWPGTWSRCSPPSPTPGRCWRAEFPRTGRRCEPPSETGPKGQKKAPAEAGALSR